MSYPRIEIAEGILQKRKEIRSGSWVQHSKNTAFIARKISEKSGMNGELAYCMGLLHDIGRSFTEGQFQHIAEGYRYMNQLGYDEIARICLTHSFAVQDIHSYVGKMDISVADVAEFQTLLKEVQYNDYDRLIQFCDCISTEDGFVLPEQKFVRSVFQYGMNKFTVQKWKEVLAIGRHFGRKIGMDLNEFVRRQVR